jgi:secreted trypsin-like serine protease
MKRGDVRLPFLSVLVVGLIGLVFVGTTTALRHRELIIGGHDAEPHRFPYYVSLDYHNGVVLSGALIAPDFVLTAGHCLENDNEKVTLRVGTYSLMNSSKENSNATMTATTDEDDEDSMILPEVVRIQQAIRHPSFLEFQTECFTHDFLLFQLQSPTHIPYAKINRDPNIPQPVTFETTTRTTTTVKHSSTAKHHHSSASTSVIVMESNDDDDDNNNNNVGYDEDPDPNAVIMMGLGWTSQYFSSPAFTLQMADLYPISNEECATQSHDPTGQLTYQGLLDSTMLCTKGGRNNTRDGCAWDSGDPVILPGSRPEEDMIVGLGSWGFGCADPNFPGMYVCACDHAS